MLIEYIGLKKNYHVDVENEMKLKIKSTSLWHIFCIFVGSKILGSFQYRGGAANFFLNNKLIMQIFIKFV
jgi:hypothetical protein